MRMHDGNKTKGRDLGAMETAENNGKCLKKCK